MFIRRPTARSGNTFALVLWIGAVWLTGDRIAVAATTIPNTPAGHMLSGWLQAFNSGGRARIQSFDKTHIPWWSLNQALAARAWTGGYDLQSVKSSGTFWIVFRAREKERSAEIIGSLVVRSYEPGHITLLSLEPASAHSDEVALDGDERARVIDGAAKLLNEYYLHPNVARKVSAKLKALQRQGRYRGITDGEIFAVRLSDDLVALSGDKHIGVDFFAKSMPRRPGPRLHPHPGRLAGGNCGFEKVGHIAPDIGYLKLSAFANPKYCRRVAISAINSLADSDALIIDLRDNHGGAPPMVALIASYLFDKPTHLDDIYYPRTRHTEQLWTNAHLPGKRFIGKPVFVLTSGSTFSAAEEFAYDLKSLKRATVIGETTGGGAHLVAPHRIDAHYFIRVPFARFVNPITKANWEGTGVQPDVRTSAADALAVAEKLAAGEISKDKSHRLGTG